MKNFLQISVLASLFILTFIACEREPVENQCRPLTAYRNNMVSATYSYDSENRVIQYKAYSSTDGELLFDEEYEYLDENSDKLKKRIIKDENGEVFYRSNYTYSASSDTMYVDNESVSNRIGTPVSRNIYVLNLSSPCLVIKYIYESLSNPSSNLQVTYGYTDDNCSAEGQRIDANGNVTSTYTRIMSPVNNYRLGAYYYPFNQQYSKSTTSYTSTNTDGIVEYSYVATYIPNEWNYPEEARYIDNGVDTVDYTYDYICE